MAIKVFSFIIITAVAIQVTAFSITEIKKFHPASYGLSGKGEEVKVGNFNYLEDEFFLNKNLFLILEAKEETLLSEDSRSPNSVVFFETEMRKKIGSFLSIVSPSFFIKYDININYWEKRLDSVISSSDYDEYLELDKKLRQAEEEHQIAPPKKIEYGDFMRSYSVTDNIYSIKMRLQNIQNVISRK